MGREVSGSLFKLLTGLKKKEQTKLCIQEKLRSGWKLFYETILYGLLVGSRRYQKIGPYRRLLWKECNVILVSSSRSR